jgi:hypothetical protein
MGKSEPAARATPRDIVSHVRCFCVLFADFVYDFSLRLGSGAHMSARKRQLSMLDSLRASDVWCELVAAGIS